MEAYINLVSQAKNISPFAGILKGGALKKYKAELDKLDMWEYNHESPENRGKIKEAWSSFSDEYVKVTLKSKAYATTGFSVVPLGEEKAQKKLRLEIEETLHSYPAFIGEEWIAKDFYEVMVEAFNRRVARINEDN